MHLTSFTRTRNNLENRLDVDHPALVDPEHSVASRDHDERRRESHIAAENSDRVPTVIGYFLLAHPVCPSKCWRCGSCPVSEHTFSVRSVVISILPPFTSHWPADGDVDRHHTAAHERNRNVCADVSMTFSNRHFNGRVCHTECQRRSDSHPICVRRSSAK